LGLPSGQKVARGASRMPGDLWDEDFSARQVAFDEREQTFSLVRMIRCAASGGRRRGYGLLCRSARRRAAWHPNDGPVPLWRQLVAADCVANQLRIRRRLSKAAGGSQACRLSALDPPTTAARVHLNHPALVAGFFLPARRQATVVVDVCHNVRRSTVSLLNHSIQGLMKHSVQVLMGRIVGRLGRATPVLRKRPHLQLEEDGARDCLGTADSKPLSRKPGLRPRSRNPVNTPAGHRSITVRIR